MGDHGVIGQKPSEGEVKHQHKGKSSERHLDKDLVLTVLNPQPGQTILDAGCGSGYMARLFAREVVPHGTVYALDPDEDAIKALDSDLSASSIETIVGDITQPTRLESAVLDLVYLSTVFHGFTQRQIEGFLKEATRLLKPGAILAIVEIEKRETPYGPPMHLRYSPEELRNMVPLNPEQTVMVGEAFYLQTFRKTR
jgi:ubiquinone/menaquinone biosynthesis C-methylase UbiE